MPVEVVIWVIFCSKNVNNVIYVYIILCALVYIRFLSDSFYNLNKYSRTLFNELCNILM